MCIGRAISIWCAERMWICKWHFQPRAVKDIEPWALSWCIFLSHFDTSWVYSSNLYGAKEGPSRPVSQWTLSLKYFKLDRIAGSVWTRRYESVMESNHCTTSDWKCTYRPSFQRNIPGYCAEKFVAALQEDSGRGNSGLFLWTWTLFIWFPSQETTMKHWWGPWMWMT